MRKTDGIIYVLFLADPELPEKAHNGDYDMKLYTSCDNGETFELRSKIPFTSTKDCFYGTMCFTPKNELLVYTYQATDAYNLKYIISKDNGFTWENNRRAYFDKKLRNPQLIYYKDRFFIHGRGGHTQELYGALVLYSSPDGINRDEGCYLRHRTAGNSAVRPICKINTFKKISKNFAKGLDKGEKVWYTALVIQRQQVPLKAFASLPRSHSKEFSPFCALSSAVGQRKLFYSCIAFFHRR